VVLLRAHQSPHPPAPNHTLRSYSGRGPTANGRIKPDVIGPTGIQTAFGSDNSSLEYLGGTAAAAPSVAGACGRPAAALPVIPYQKHTHTTLAWLGKWQPRKRLNPSSVAQGLARLMMVILKHGSAGNLARPPSSACTISMCFAHICSGRHVHCQRAYRSPCS
jgi:hypothetical protein